ncbi:MAG: J domain-containing protein [Candidatus Dechloromonas phosphoritropha]
MNHDPHSVLGLAPDAGPGDLKRAYRRLAMHWHPDRNGDPAAPERFRQIRAAYEELAAVDGKEGATTAKRDDRPAAASRKAADIRLNLDISLEQAALGCRRTVEVTRGKPCATCDGSGEAGVTRTRFCAACHGSGRVRDAKRVLVTCDECAGRGFFSTRICPDCAGSGRELGRVSLKINVPAGMLPGDDLRLAGQGEPATAELAAGDLYLTVLVRSHSLFQLRGRDLHFAMPVSALALMAGDEIRLPSLSNPVSLTLDPGPPEAREVRIPGKGYPGRGKHQAGDLVVRLDPVFPATLTARQRRLLLKANAALMDGGADSLPEIVAWNREHRGGPPEA